MELEQQLNETFSVPNYTEKLYIVENLPDINGVKVINTEGMITETVIEYVEKEGYKLRNVQSKEHRVIATFEGI